MTTQNGVLNVPNAIVVAGIIIAGAIFFSQGGANQFKKDPSAALNRNDSLPRDFSVKQIDSSDHFFGKSEAEVILVEYSDTECPFCKRFHITVNQLLSSYSDEPAFGWAYRHFPLDEIHPKARKEAEALECASELGGFAKFQAYLDRLFEVTPSNNGLDLSELPNIATFVGLDRNAFVQCLNSGKYAKKVDDDANDGIKSGVTGTPGNFLILKNPITKKQQEYLNSLYEVYRGPDGKLPITYSLDGKTIAITGALPYLTMKSTIDSLIE